MRCMVYFYFLLSQIKGFVKYTPYKNKITKVDKSNATWQCFQLAAYSVYYNYITNFFTNFGQLITSCYKLYRSKSKLIKRWLITKKGCWCIVICWIVKAISLLIRKYSFEKLLLVLGPLLLITQLLLVFKHMTARQHHSLQCQIEMNKTC